MSTDMSSRPTDELDSAQATLDVLHQVLHHITGGDFAKQTPCSEFNVAQLTDHLMNSITVIGVAAGADLPHRDRGALLEHQVMTAALPAVDAWRRRGLDGTVTLGPNTAPAPVMAGVLSLEFLVHAWDFAVATGVPMVASDALSEYVLGLAQGIITPEGRANVGFDPPVDVPPGAGALDRLVAYTGRRPR